MYGTFAGMGAGKPSHTPVAFINANHNNIHNIPVCVIIIMIFKQKQVTKHVACCVTCKMGKYNMKRLLILIFLNALISIIMPLIYYVLFRGPFESLIVYWLYLSAFIGVVVLLTLILLCTKKNVNKLYNVAIIQLLILSIIQIPPIWLWINLHGYKIADCTYSNAFIAHMGYSLLHFIPLLLCLFTISQIREIVHNKVSNT